MQCAERCTPCHCIAACVHHLYQICVHCCLHVCIVTVHNEYILCVCCTCVYSTCTLVYRVVHVQCAHVQVYAHELSIVVCT